MSDQNAPADPALRIREMPVAQRPRERLTRLGASALSAVELLALVLGSGGAGKSALDLGKQVLAHNGGSLRRLAPVAAIRAINGVGPAKAVVLHAALELGRRLASESRNVGEPISGPMAFTDTLRLGWKTCLSRNSTSPCSIRSTAWSATSR